MSEYRRLREGSMYFFTVVTYMRQPVLCQDGRLKALEEVITEVRRARPFEVKAWAVLPDHLHAIWELPDGDTDYSARWAIIKKEFTKRTSGNSGTQELSRSRIKRREGGVWQRRFWEHAIRGPDDLRAHVEYIHYNPVKHGIVGAPRDWKHSSFHKYVDEGIYPLDWGEDVIEFKGIGAE